MAIGERGHRSRGGILVGVHLGRGRGLCTGGGRPQWGILWGAIIAVIGLGLLVDNLNIFPAFRVYQFWPMILIAAGVMNIACRSGRMFGVILLLVGTLFQLSEFGILHFCWAQLWP